MNRRFVSAVDWFIPLKVKQDSEQLYRARIVVGFTFTLVPWGPFFTMVHYLSGAPPVVYLAPGISASVAAFAPMTLRMTSSLALAASQVIGSLVIASGIAALGTGGSQSTILLVWPAVPIMAVYMAGIPTGIFWSVLCMADVLVLFLLEGGLATIGTGFSPPGPIMLINVIFCCLVLSLINEGVRASLFRQLREQQQKLINASKMAALGEMSGGMAHEINTPLAIIKLNSELIRNGMAAGEVSSASLDRPLRSIGTAVDRISTIISGLRWFAKDADQDPIVHCDLNQLIARVLDLFREQFRAKGISIVSNQIPEGLSVPCRDVQIAQVLINLMNNAMDAAAAAPGKQVEISVRCEDTMVVITVADSGWPIPQEVRAKMFQPFFTTKEVGKGTGMGLSISQGIVASHGGTLTLDESSSRTKFVLRLPR